MRVSFFINQVQQGWQPTDTRLGGTEESVVQWSEWLVKMGHAVTVYRNSPDRDFPLYYNGVLYREREEYRPNATVCINVKSSDLKPQEATIYLTNETDANRKDLSRYLGVIWPSEWAEEHIPVNNPIRFVLPHGYNPDEIYPDRKIAKQCLYASSPDRGLEVLLRAWPIVHRVHTDATLLVTYGADYEAPPGVFFLGNVDEDQMNQLYRESDIWCHPCTGGELYCMTGIKAQAAGCVPVVIPTMALKETVRHYYKARPENYAEVLLRAMNEPHEYTRKLLAEEHYPTWEDSTMRLLEIIDTCLN